MKGVLVVRTVDMGFWITQSLHYHCGPMHHLSLSRGRQAWRRWQTIGLLKTLQLASIIIFSLPQLSISIGSRPLRAFVTAHSGPLPLSITQTVKSSSSQEGNIKMICDSYWNITRFQEIREYGERRRKVPILINIHYILIKKLLEFKVPTKGS